MSRGNIKAAATRWVSAIKELGDGWFNPTSGLGRSPSEFIDVAGFVPPLYWARLYDGDWLARKIVDLLPSYALRHGFKPKGSTDSDPILKKFQSLNVNMRHPDGCLKAGLCAGRMAGGAFVLIGLDTNPTLPAEPGDGEVIWLDTVRRDQMNVVTRNEDQNSPDVGMPLLYEVLAPHPRHGLKIHASRVIPCEGLTSETYFLLRRYDQLRLPWISVLQPVRQTIADMGMSWNAVSHLLQESSIGVLKISGLIDMLSAEDTTDAEARLELLNHTKSVGKMLFLDSDKDHQEEFSRTEVSFNGVAPTLLAMMQNVAGAADQPMTLLFGMSPGGMNATGESDLTQWYDRVEGYRENNVKLKAERILSFVAGKPIEVEFGCVWEPTETQKAAVRLQNVQADQILFNCGAVDGAEITIARLKDGSLGLDLGPDALAQKTKELAAQRAETEVARTNASAATDPAQGTRVNPGTPAKSPDKTSPEGKPTRYPNS